MFNCAVNNPLICIVSAVVELPKTTSSSTVKSFAIFTSLQKISPTLFVRDPKSIPVARTLDLKSIVLGPIVICCVAPVLNSVNCVESTTLDIPAPPPTVEKSILVSLSILRLSKYCNSIN